MFSFGLVSCFPAFLIKFGGPARVVEWQTRTFEGRMPKGMRVQVPPRALLDLHRGVVPLARQLIEDLRFAAIRPFRIVLHSIASWQYGFALSCRRRSTGALRVRACDHPF